MRSMIRTGMVVIAALSLAACGDDDPVSPEPFALQGEWIYSASGLTGILPEDPLNFPGFQRIAATCAVGPTRLSIGGGGQSFSGVIEDLQLTCELLNEATFGARQVAVEVLGPVPAVVADGSEDGGSVSFRIVPDLEAIIDWTNQGESDGSFASGRVRIQAEVSEVMVELTGRWTARRP